jgi:predicted RNase H-like HicB family nuclease
MSLMPMKVRGHSFYSEEETRRNFQDALIAHFEAMREAGEPIPAAHFG